MQLGFWRTARDLLFASGIFRLGLPGVKFATRSTPSYRRLCRRTVTVASAISNRLAPGKWTLN
ncbi:MAG: hypothetical protein DMF26_15855 [Verrucomicrobia bacterium]|nr:MAG: hypothetical protein DMF26_15855 [Verrucomicrobiota bacterium]